MKKLNWCRLLLAGLMVYGITMAALSQEQPDPERTEALREKLIDLVHDDSWRDYAEPGLYVGRTDYVPVGERIAEYGEEAVPIVLEMLAEPLEATRTPYVWLVALRKLHDRGAFTDTSRAVETIVQLPLEGKPEGGRYVRASVLHSQDQAVKTLGHFGDHAARDALRRIMNAGHLESEMRIYAASYLLRFDGDAAREAERFIRADYEQHEKTSTARPASRAIAYWRLEDPEIREAMVSAWESLWRRTDKAGGFRPPWPYAFLLEIMSDGDKEIAPLVKKFLDADGKTFPEEESAVPLSLLEHVLEYYSEDVFPRPWVKEKCLQHGLFYFQGIGLPSIERTVKRWVALRHKLFPELEPVEPTIYPIGEYESFTAAIEDLEARGLYDRRAHRLLFDIDPDTGLAVPRER